MIIERLQNLERREQLVLAVGAGVLIVILLHLSFIQPLQSRIERETRNVARMEADLAWMMQAAEQIHRHGTTATAAGRTDSEPAYLLVDTALRESDGLPMPNRLEPQGDAAARVELRNAPYQSLMTQLADLEHAHRLRAVQVRMVRSDTGHVDADLLLERSGGKTE